MIKKIINKTKSIFSAKSKRQESLYSGESYMDSKEFHDDVLKAVKEGAKDQDKYMKSVGASWD